MEEEKKWQTYIAQDLILEESDPQLPYRGRGQEQKLAIGWGQRKLALTLIQFLNYEWHPQQSTHPIIVYAGAAPGLNITFVADLYPQVEWHLYDPQSFAIKPRPNIHIYNKLFTNDIAKEWHYQTGNNGKNKYILFVSDIRTASTDMPPLEIEQKVQQDMMYQMQWVELMQPVAAHLKFRLPYSDKGLDLTIPIPYLNGAVFKQAWARPTSTESRLVIKRKDMINGQYPSKQWLAKIYEDQMFYHNAVIRDTVYFYNPFYLGHENKRHDPIWENELTNDWDSITELTIWNDYLDRHNHKNIYKGIIQLCKLLTLHLSPKGKDIKSIQVLRNDNTKED